jgi:hypothetical protein
VGGAAMIMLATSSLTLSHLDFGLFKIKQTDKEIWFRGYGVDQYVYYVRQGPKQFLGGAFQVATFEDLER